MPAQPPFLMPKRTPATGFSAFATISRTRAAAASVMVRIEGFGRGAFMTAPYTEGWLPNIGRSPKVEGKPGFLGHAALIPGRIEGDIDLHGTDPLHRAHGVLDH